MLRDSKVAQEVRNQALNIIESATDEHKTFEITKEKELLMAIMFASNEIERATAINVHLGGSSSDSPHKLKGGSILRGKGGYLIDGKYMLPYTKVGS